MICPNCKSEVAEDAKFCPRCGSALSEKERFIMATTPSIPGYKIRRVLGVVTAITPRTRGVLGKFIASWQSVIGGEVTAFTEELEKARKETMERLVEKAQALGANAIVGVDFETSDLGIGAGIVVVSATGTAVLIEPEA
jgi:uncharacterized protein YbjQ (UPF0145 family)